jgi:hypothetical protein
MLFILHRSPLAEVTWCGIHRSGTRIAASAHHDSEISAELLLMGMMIPVIGGLRRRLLHYSAGGA